MTAPAQPTDKPATTAATTRTTTAKAGTPKARATVTTADDRVTAQVQLQGLPAVDLDARKPLYAFAGLADLLVEQAQAVPNELAARVQQLPQTVPAQVKTLSEDVQALVDSYGEKAADLYAQLTVRGERLVTSIRRQPATEAAIAEGKEAVRKAAAAAVAARKSLKAGEKAVEDSAHKIG